MIMPRTSRRRGVVAPRPPVPGHLFAVGQRVRLKSATFRIATSSTARFRVLATMPARDGSLQYRIRDAAETFDRVMTEDLLEAAPGSAANDLFTRTKEGSTDGQRSETQ